MKETPALLAKGIGAVLECVGVEEELRDPLEDAKNFVSRLLSEYSGSPISRVEFSDNEPIGTSYVLYKYHAYYEDGFAASCRAVVRKHILEEVVCSFDKSKVGKLRRDLPWNQRGRKPVLASSGSAGRQAPGQVYIDHFIIYRILGTPAVKADSWKLVVRGLVSSPLELSLDDIERLPRESLVKDFHCVTGWSVPSVQWEGVRLKLLVEMARPSEKARWVLIAGLDGYTSIVPLEDFASEDALLVLRVNGKPLSLEQGFPARIFIPHLYGWKSVKWVNRIEFIDKYVDGYWEALGYHERGNVFLEERFKKT